MPNKNQAVVTVASGPFADRLDDTFISFARNPFLNLHAFIVGEKLPARMVPGITYHLKAPDPAFFHPMRDMYYRRLLFLDDLEEEYILLVDNSDVLCMQPLPELPALLRDAAFAGCVEHAGSRYFAGQGYTGCYINTGVTFWNRAASRTMREDIVARGKTCFRSVEDQLTINEVIQTKYFDRMIVLPSQYNFRAHYRLRKRGWPTVESLDGVVIYHNAPSMREAKKVKDARPRAILPPLEADQGEPGKWDLFVRRVRHRLERHIVR